MKKYLFLSLLFIVSFDLTAQSQDISNPIVGQWKFSKLKTESPMDTKKQSELINNMRLYVLNINADHTYTMPDGKNQNQGTWRQGKDALEITTFKGEEDVLYIKNIDKNTLEMTLSPDLKMLLSRDIKIQKP